MPAPIVIRNLSPETKKAANPEPGEPLIATKADLRDGTRLNSGGGNDPAPGDGIDPIDGLPTTWETEPDWKSLLTVYGNGTADPAMGADPEAGLDSRLTYLGAFRIPYFEGSTNTRVGTDGMQAMTFKPADGTNGANGSLFLAHGTDGKGYAAEVQIPELSLGTDVSSLNPVTVLQTWANIWDKAPTGNVNDSSPAGWIRYKNGKLYVTGYKGYDNDGNSHNLLILDDPTDLINSTAQGFLSLGTDENAARYVFDIPLEHQEYFGGTLMSGACTDMSIVNRASKGHSALAWDPSMIGAGDTEAATTEWLYYPPGNEINGFSVTNDGVAGHYSAMLFPPGEFDMLNFYAADDPNLTHNWGLDGIAAYNGLPIGAPNGRTRSTFAGLSLPDPSLRAHTVQHNTGCGCAFFLPGTDTLCFIGNQEGSRYGNGYKNYRIEQGPDGKKGGGYARLSDTDADNAIWLFNVNDVKNRVNPYDPDLYFHTFKNDLGPFNGFDHKIVSGQFDPATNRLYLLSDNHEQNQYVGQHVVSVFQVGSGS